MKIKDMKRRRRKVLNQLVRLSGWITGSLVKTERTQNGKKSPFNYLSRSRNGSNRITYVASADLDIFSESVQNGKIAKRLFEQITELTIAIIKAEQQQQKGKRR